MDKTFYNATVSGRIIGTFCAASDVDVWAMVATELRFESVASMVEHFEIHEDAVLNISKGSLPVGVLAGSSYERMLEVVQGAVGAEFDLSAHDAGRAWHNASVTIQAPINTALKWLEGAQSGRWESYFDGQRQQVVMHIGHVSITVDAK